jgi:hypothetical protein
MSLELVMDICKSNKSASEIRELLPKELEKLNGVFTLKEFVELM